MENTIKKLNKEFGPVKWVQTQVKNDVVPPGNWLRFYTEALPPENEIEKVTNDISNNREYIVNNCELYQSDEHYKDDEYKNLITKKLKKTFKRLTRKKYEVIVYLNRSKFWHNQPLIFVTKPSIDFVSYPNHLHINDDFNVNIRGNNYYVPNSICYNFHEDSLGDNEYDIVIESLSAAVEWLFKHQLWYKYYELFDENLWIGDHIPYFDESCIYLKLINPLGSCRCGSKKKYYNCCMRKDYVCYNKKNILNPNHRNLEYDDFVKVLIKKHLERNIKQKKFVSNIRKIFN